MDGSFDAEAWNGFVQFLCMLNEANGGPLPEPVQIVRARREAARAAQKREADAEREEANLKRKAEREVDKAERKEQKRAVKEARAVEIMKVQADGKARSRDRRFDELSVALQKFLDDHCETGTTFKISSSAFKQALTDYGVDKSAADIKTMMEKKGFRYKRSNGSHFCGLKLANPIQEEVQGKEGKKDTKVV